jgi:DNA-binding beta-propeller fold protein YncE
MIALAGAPFGVATTADGRFSFVDVLGAGSGGGVTVFADAHGRLRPLRTIQVAASTVGNALTDDGRYLLAADGEEGATVLSVARAETGAADAVLGRLEPPPGAASGSGPGGGAIEVTSSRDGAYAFVSVEYSDEVTVYDLRAALADHFSHSSYVGSIPLGQAVVGMAVSPDGRRLYVTSELAAGTRSPSAPGTLSVISIPTAEDHPSRSVIATVKAGCQPVRVVVSSDGDTVWVTARASDDLLAFSAKRLGSDPTRALIAAVRVGEAPVGLALARHDTRIVVADSNRFHASGASSALTVVNVQAALAGKPAVLGTLPAGSFPREIADTPHGTTLLVGNFASNQLETINAAALP